MNHKKSVKQKSQRQLQLGEQIKRIVAEIFMQDNVLVMKGGYITVLQADVSPDAKNVKIFLDIFGEVDARKAINEINQSSSYLRGRIAGKINWRCIPELNFILDETDKNINKIENLLKKEGEKFKNQD